VAQGVATDEVAGGGLTLTAGVLVASAPIAFPASASLTNCAAQFEGDPNTGLAWLSADTIAVVAGGTSRLSMGTFNQFLGLWLFNGNCGLDSGTSLSNCPLQKNGDANTGLSSPGGADTMSGVAGGTEVFRWGTGTFGVFSKIAAPAAQQTSGANLTNSVTSGGTDDTIANFTDLNVYAVDAAAIRNDIYQLARKVKQINDGLRLLGWLT
jgi:hypothetical protein